MPRARVVVFNTRTGDFIEDVPYSKYSWSQTINEPDTLDATIGLQNPDAAAMDWDSVATPLKTSLAIIEGDMVSAGVIWPHGYGKNDKSLKLTAKGVWSLFDQRSIMPVAALTTPLLLTSGDDIGSPNPALATSFTGKSWAYIVRTLLQQSMAFPGGEVPLVFGDDGTGSHDKSYDAASFKKIGAALTDITKLQNGPEIRFEPRLRADRQGIEYVVRVGTDAAPRLISVAYPTWDYSVPQPGIKGLTVDTDASGMASASWATGGKPDAVALWSLSLSSELTDAGYPYTDVVDTSHTDVTVQSTLDSYTAENLRIGARPTQFWPFSARKDVEPLLSDYTVGDYCRVKIKNDPYLNDGTYTRRIVARSGDESLWVKITTGVVYG